jgi:hypothetical protein
MGGIRTKLKILTMILIVIVITTSILPLILTLDISLQNLNRQIVVEQQELFILRYQAPSYRINRSSDSSLVPMMFIS